MQFVLDPVKSKRVFILMLVLTIVFFASAGTLGYFYYKEVQNYKKLTSENQSLQNDLSKAQAQLVASQGDLQKQIKDLQDKLAAENTKSIKAKKYLDVLQYLCDLAKTHGGLDGWTDADYQKGRNMAQETGDSSFVSVVDWAWNRKDIDQITRLIRFLEAVATGVNTNL